MNLRHITFVVLTCYHHFVHVKCTIIPPSFYCYVFQGVDEAYDQALYDYFYPYYLFIDLLCRVAVNQLNITQELVTLSAMVACEGVPLYMPLFAKLWSEIYQAEHISRQYVAMLCNCSSFIDYVDAVLLDERKSLNTQIIYHFFCNYFPKVLIFY